MILPCHICTRRLELIPADLKILISDQHHHHKELGRLLGAAVPEAWPPQYLDDAALAEFVRMQSDGSDFHFCSWYWVIAGPKDQDRILIGSGGIASSPAYSGSAYSGAVMMGYSVLEPFQNKGYATEAVGGMIPVIFQYPGIRRIIATTYPDLKASIRVLEKNGFEAADRADSGDGMRAGIEEGTLMYVLEKSPA